MPVLRIYGWRTGLGKISMTHALLSHSALGLAEAKGVTDRVLSGESVDVALPTLGGASKLARVLDELGAISTIVADVPGGRAT
jgi:hypothetical protein